MHASHRDASDYAAQSQTERMTTLNRPDGTRNIAINSPTINRRAIFNCPSGTKKGQLPYKEPKGQKSTSPHILRFLKTDTGRHFGQVVETGLTKVVSVLDLVQKSES